jgi:hypothetical protein
MRPCSKPIEMGYNQKHYRRSYMVFRIKSTTQFNSTARLSESEIFGVTVTYWLMPLHIRSWLPLVF